MKTNALEVHSSVNVLSASLFSLSFSSAFLYISSFLKDKSEIYDRTSLM